MPRRNDIPSPPAAALAVVYACTTAFCYACTTAFCAEPALHATDRKVTIVFCVPGEQGHWELQRFKPLIDIQRRTEFAEMSFMGGFLGDLKLRRFSPASETMFDYKFDSSGKLNALEGTVKVFGQWVGEANLFPDANGKIGEYQVKFSLNNSRVPRPDNARSFVDRLDEAPVYMTAQTVPCGAQLKEAERLNATQE